MEPAILTPNIIDRARTPFAAAARWGADPASVKHISDGASFTYRFRLDDRVYYLRLTPPGWQSFSEVRGEISFIRAVRGAGISTPLPVRSLGGEFIEGVADRGMEFLAVVFEEAPGRPLDPDEWDEQHITRWGRLLAELHDAAPRTLPDGENRKDWQDDLPQILNWLPDSETDAHNHLARVTQWLQSLPRDPGVYGLVHVDLMGDNVLWAGSSPTVIDFDDCMFHWFAADIARALGTFRSEATDRRRILTRWLLEGYQQARRLDPVTAELLPEFVRLISIGSLASNLYSRSRGFGSVDGVQDAENLRSLVADPGRWGL
ncbi:MAG: phosphotransferase enzyme family protein [Dehalococcoidia bacterium]